MITEQDLQAAIAECEGQRNPNANTCIKLAAFYTIRDHLFPHTDAKPTPEPVIYSTASKPPGEEYQSNTDFADLVYGMDKAALMPVMDELMTTLSVLNPRLYAGVMRKLEEIP